MSIPQTKRKLREARYFYGKMHERARMAFGEHEEFDFFLSAFLNAGRSVSFVLQKERSDEYKAFFSAWKKALQPSEQQLLDFMNSERVSEVHRTGSTRDRQNVVIPIRHSYRDESGSVSLAAPPGLEKNPASVFKPVYFFKVDGIERNVLDVCKEYIDLLGVLIEEFCKGSGTQWNENVR